MFKSFLWSYPTNQRNDLDTEDMKDVDDDDAAVDVEENSHEWATKSETQTNQ